MNQKKVVLIGVVALVALGAYMFFDYSSKNKVSTGAMSRNIMYLTQPIYFFTGVVDKVEGNIITLSQKQVPTPKTVTLSYRVTVSNKTQYAQPMMNTMYLFKTAEPISPPKASLKDIKVGATISVNSAIDLRTLEGSSFDAVSINLSQKITILNGKIAAVNGNIITLKAFPPMIMGMYPGSMIGVTPIPPQEKEYTITLTQGTEISRYVYNNSASSAAMMVAPKAERVAQTDLKKDMQVTVYTDADVTRGSVFTALRIEPMMSATPNDSH